MQKSAFIWNTVSGLLMAFQSVLMLIVLMRVSSVVEAGIFTIAYANANLFLNIGKYGVRNYQVSDITQQFAFPAYFRARVASTVAMVVCGSAYLAISAVSVGYSWEKTLVVLVMCLFKAIDSVEDVFHGDYQQKNRLDVAGKVLSLRLASTLVVFCAIDVATTSLLGALVAATVYSTVFFIASVWWVRRKYTLPKRADCDGKGGDAWRILKSCFPLFLAAFLLFYIGNAPKYAIDSCLSDTEQALYGFISMPVFVVGLLASFAYNPIITALSGMWQASQIRPFLHEFLKQVGIVVAITVVCDTGTALIGIPVLSWLYNIDLAPYFWELLILVTGGGFLALATLFTMGITIIRVQKKLMWGYVTVSVAGFVLSSWFVSSWGITGASWEYLVLMGVLSVWFAVVFFRNALRGDTISN